MITPGINIFLDCFLFKDPLAAKGASIMKEDFSLSSPHDIIIEPKTFKDSRVALKAGDDQKLWRQLLNRWARLTPEERMASPLLLASNQHQ